MLTSGICVIAEPDLTLGLYHALAQLSQQVIWVLSDEELLLLANASLHMPTHILPAAFVPQNDILGHSHAAAFVTQGGTNSFHEVSQTPDVNDIRLCTSGN